MLTGNYWHTDNCIHSLWKRLARNA